MTPEELDVIESYWQSPTGGVHEAAVGLAQRNIVALVGELRAERGFRDECERQLQSWIERVNEADAALRAERTRTETLRTALEKIASPREDVSLGAWLIAQKALGDLAASVEETP